MMIVFKEDTQEMLQRLQNDLCDYGDDFDVFNLRLLRNHILNNHKNINIVFGWGIADERLCQEFNDEKYLSATMLTPFSKYRISRIACGETFSLALDEDGDVYSWGIGQNGSLGHGETIMVASQPKRIRF